jgi:hypothetical protein
MSHVTWYNEIHIESPEALGILGITDIYLNDNFEPTTPFLSDPKKLDFEFVELLN